MPWARSFCPFRAYEANPLNVIASGRMGLTFFYRGLTGLTVNSCFLYGQPSDSSILTFNFLLPEALLPHPLLLQLRQEDSP